MLVLLRGWTRPCGFFRLSGGELRRDQVDGCLAKLWTQVLVTLQQSPVAGELRGHSVRGPTQQEDCDAKVAKVVDPKAWHLCPRGRRPEFLTEVP